MEQEVCDLSFSENLNTKKIQIKTNNRLLNAKIVGDFFKIETGNGKTFI